jgi:hypothetical protein
MDFFEECKADWLKQQREDYLRNPFTREEIDRAIAEAKRRERKQLLRDSLGGGLFCLTVAAFAAIIAVETSLIVRIGTGLVMASFIAEFLLAAWATWRERNRRLDLPLKPYLIEERNRVRGELRRLKVRLALYLVPIAGGIVLLPWAQEKIGFFIGFILAACVVVVAGLATRLLRSRGELGEYLQTLEGDLANIAEIEAEGE